MISFSVKALSWEARKRQFVQQKNPVMEIIIFLCSIGELGSLDFFSIGWVEERPKSSDCWRSHLVINVVVDRFFARGGSGVDNLAAFGPRIIVVFGGRRSWGRIWFASF